MSKDNASTQQSVFRKMWLGSISFDWKFGVFLILLFAIPRFIIALNNAVHGGSQAIFLLYLSMWFIPFIFLTTKGRRLMGIKKPDKWITLFYAFLAGLAFCGIYYLITCWLFGNSVNNSFTYMSRVFGMSPEMMEAYRSRIFIASLVMGMTFSPVGEELLYRGMVHESFIDKFGTNKASIIDSLAFTLVHLPHFGIIYDAGEWSFPFFPALLWMFSMFILSRLFFKCKVLSQSIWGAVLAHSGYNFLMMYITFYHIL